ncbi:MAG: hypothetical protein GTO55_02905 [Armatimonadetes bacterium]|nr:hypothetical protein [Armatimonadota bacterium]NIM23225.1 hypothetical protein [Armatimonadota bacterium]NIM67093.1 hypothetical protein [Armatimonadota bacterium]NIM75620.1 hypothetical protein [Armatimonadota bacterium]NIN05282.1 hypothetical protein [Armatimonadota bacterium]
MKVYVLAIAAAMMLVCAAGAFAYPTIDTGATGVVALPTAEITPQGTLELAVDHQHGPYDWDVALTRASWGVAKNLELNVSHARWSRQNYWDEIDQGGLKYQIPMDFANVAIGASFGRDKWASYEADATKVYLAVSKELPVTSSVSARLTAGGLYTRWDGDLNNVFEFTKPYATLELMLGRGVMLGVEYRERDDDWDLGGEPISTVLRITSQEKPVWVEVGTTNMSWAGESWGNQRGFIGIGFALGD